MAVLAQPASTRVTVLLRCTLLKHARAHLAPLDQLVFDPRRLANAPPHTHTVSPPASQRHTGLEEGHA